MPSLSSLNIDGISSLLFVETLSETSLLFVDEVLDKVPDDCVGLTITRFDTLPCFGVVVSTRDVEECLVSVLLDKDELKQSFDTQDAADETIKSLD